MRQITEQTGVKIFIKTNSIGITLVGGDFNLPLKNIDTKIWIEKDLPSVSIV